MSYYVFYCEDAKNVLEKRKSVRPAHLARLEMLSKEGRLLLAGPMTQEDNMTCGSLIIAAFQNLAEAKAWIAADPYVTAEVYQRVIVKSFQATFKS